MVGEAGLEPAHLAALDPKSSASANSATRPQHRRIRRSPDHGIPMPSKAIRWPFGGRGLSFGMRLSFAGFEPGDLLLEQIQIKMPEFDGWFDILTDLRTELLASDPFVP